MRLPNLLSLVFLLCLGSIFLQGQNTNQEQKTYVFLYKYDFYAQLKKQLPFGWQISERDGDIIVSKNSVTVLENDPRLNTKGIPLDQLEANYKSYALKNMKSKVFEVVVNLERFAKADFLDGLDNKAEIQENINDLRKRYRISDRENQYDDITYDPMTGSYMAFTRDAKNRLAKFQLAMRDISTTNQPKSKKQKTIYFLAEATNEEMGYSAKVEYLKRYFRIYPPQILTEANEIENIIYTILDVERKTSESMTE